MSRHGIIPPIILENIERNGTEAQKARARTARLLTAMVMAKREAGKAYDPGIGENREVRDAQGTTNDGGPVVRAEDTTDTGDPSIDHVYDNDGVSFAFLSSIHHRAGPDGQAGRLLSIIHYSDTPGRGWDNAAYYRDPVLGMVMVVGDGDIFPPFHLSPGVVYHEWGHAFTEATCGLGYGNDDVGGNNEAGSDILSALTEQWWRQQTAGQASWLIGPELFAHGLQGRALRDMLRRGPAYDDPLLGRDPQIDDASQYKRGQDPHVTSAVTNRWFAEACLRFPDRKAWETIGPVWFDAWAHRMTAKSGFTAVAKATFDAATTLYGATSPELDAVKWGWDAVKVTIPTGPAPDPIPTPIPDSPCQVSADELLALGRAVLGTVYAHPVGKKLWRAGRTLNKESQ